MKALPQGPIFGMKIADAEITGPTKSGSPACQQKEKSNKKSNESNKKTLHSPFQRSHSSPSPPTPDESHVDSTVEAASSASASSSSPPERKMYHHNRCSPTLPQKLTPPHQPYQHNHPHLQQHQPRHHDQRSQQMDSTTSTHPKDILRKLFPSYDESILDHALLQNDHNLVKTIQKLAPHHHPHTPSCKSGHAGKR